MVHYNWIDAHYTTVYGSVPAPGVEWQFKQTGFDDQSGIRLLDCNDCIDRVERIKSGTIWQTNRDFADTLRRVARKRGDDPERALLPAPVDGDGADDGAKQVA